MPAAVLIPLIAAGVAAGGTVAAAKMSSGAARDAANATSAAATKSAEIGDDASKRAETFQRQQAEQQWQQQQQVQKANYDQWRSREARIGSVAESLGLGGRDIPDYSPGVDPHFDSSTAPLPGAGAPGAPAGAPGAAPNAAAGPINWTAPPDQLASQLSAYFKSKGVPDTETPYWVSKAGELVARGQELNDPSYADKRLSQANVFGGGGATSAPQVQSVGAYLNPAALNPSYVPLAPALKMPGSVGSYL